MELKFEFSTASQIIFGNNSLERLPALPLVKGKKILLVTGISHERRDHLIQLIGKTKSEVSLFRIKGEPAIEVVTEGKSVALKNNCDLVIGMGGGSVIDCAKAIAAITPNEGELTEYLEVIGTGRLLEKSPLPFIAIPTTAGTGAEVTKNAVIQSPSYKTKVSLRSNQMFPDVALVDPMLTHSMPPELTATTGIDALTHLLESFVSKQSNPFIDNICRQGMGLIANSLVNAFHDGSNTEARGNMSMASLLGGMALANARLGAVHGFAGPLGGMFSIPHGVVCACLLPAVFEANIRALEKQELGKQQDKFNEIARIFTGNGKSNALDALNWILNLTAMLRIPRLSFWGISKSDFPELVEKAKNSSSMKGNPVELTDNELMTILENSF